MGQIRVEAEVQGLCAVIFERFGSVCGACPLDKIPKYFVDESEVRGRTRFHEGF